MLPLSFQRFKAKPPGSKAPPPKDRIDVFFNPTTGRFEAEDSEKTPIYFNTDQSGPVTTDDLLTEPSNGSAEAGALGEYKQSGGIAPIGSSATPQNVASILLTPGDWDVSGQVGLTETLGPVTVRRLGISTVSATLPGTGQVAMDIPTSGTFGTVTLVASRRRISVASDTTVYLVASVTFGGGTVGYDSLFTARRVR